MTIKETRDVVENLLDDAERDLADGRNYPHTTAIAQALVALARIAEATLLAPAKQEGDYPELYRIADVLWAHADDRAQQIAHDFQEIIDFLENNQRNNP